MPIHRDEVNWRSSWPAGTVTVTVLPGLVPSGGEGRRRCGGKAGTTNFQVALRRADRLMKPGFPLSFDLGRTADALPPQCASPRQLALVSEAQSGWLKRLSGDAVRRDVRWTLLQAAPTSSCRRRDHGPAGHRAAVSVGSRGWCRHGLTRRRGDRVSLQSRPEEVNAGEDQAVFPETGSLGIRARVRSISGSFALSTSPEAPPEGGTYPKGTTAATATAKLSENTTNLTHGVRCHGSGAFPLPYLATISALAHAPCFQKT